MNVSDVFSFRISTTSTRKMMRLAMVSTTKPSHRFNVYLQSICVIVYFQELNDELPSLETEPKIDSLGVFG